MQCQAVLKRLNLVVDGERLPGLGAYAETCLHCARCVRCRAAWAMLRGQRRLCRALPVGAVPSELRARVLSSLPPMEPAMPGARRRTARRGWLAGAAAVGALAVIGGGTLLSGTGSQVLASDVGASISRARSWHLVGWRKVGDRQQSWEVWGRRAPYLYREQSGDDLLVDNGATRLQTFSKGNGKVLAVRMPSQRTPESARWTRLTVGQNWSREEPWSVTRDTLIFRWTDSGMQGPGSVAHDYFFVDRSTKLPRRWEYRHVKGEREEVVEMMTAEYNVAPPPAASLAAPPPGSTVVDAMGATGSFPPGENAQSAGGVTAQLIPVKAAPDGTVLIRLRSWLGNARMDLQGGPLFTSIAHPIWARTIDGKAHPWPVKDELGRPYVWVHDLRNGSGIWGDVLDGDHVLYLVPLEPLAAGAPLPRHMQISLTMLPSAQTERGSHILTRQEFTWNVRLPDRPSPILETDYMVADTERRVQYKEDVPLPVRIAQARSGAYESQSQAAGTIRWLKTAISLLPPDSDYAQFLRGNLAHQYGRSGDEASKVTVLREIVEVKRQYPHTWGHYARIAQWQLDNPKPPKGRQSKQRGDRPQLPAAE